MAKKDKVIDADFKELDENGNPIEKPEEEKKESDFGKKLKKGAKTGLRWLVKGIGYGLGAIGTAYVALKVTAPKKHFVDIPLKGDDQDDLTSTMTMKFPDTESLQAALDNGMEVKFDDK